jgi:hypothetical protein
MNEQEILDNAPPNTSIVDSQFTFFNDIYCQLNSDGQWNWTSKMPKYPIRSLADIKELVELRKSNAEIEKERDRLHKIVYLDSKPHNLRWHDKGVDSAIAELTICYRVALDEHKDLEDAEVLEGLIDRLQALKDKS